MKTPLLSIITLSLLASCGKVESPRDVFGLKADDGKDGDSCYLETVPGGRNLICGPDSTFIADGTDGADGQDGTDGVDGEDGEDGEDGTFQGYVEYRAVCPGVQGSYIEQLLYLDGEYMAFLSSPQWKQQRMVVLEEGPTYKTTDGRNVLFRIVNGEIDCL